MSDTVPDRFLTTQEKLPDGRWRVQAGVAEPAEADSWLEASVQALANLSQASGEWAAQSGTTGGVRQTEALQVTVPAFLARLVKLIWWRGLGSGHIAQLEAVARTLSDGVSTMTPEWAETLATIRARHVAATSGPWRWSGSSPRDGGKGRRVVSLATVHGYAPYEHVLQFERWGAEDAQPRFGTANGSMVSASECLVHRDESSDAIAGIDNANATFIAAAWSDMQALLTRVDELEAQLATQVGGAQP